MKMATVFDSSEPVSMIRRQRGIISVERRKLMTSELSFCCGRVFPHDVSDLSGRARTSIIILTLTNAPMTPRDVNLKYSNGLVLLVVLRNG